MAQPRNVDLYGILGIQKSADSSDIKKVFTLATDVYLHHSTCHKALRAHARYISNEFGYFSCAHTNDINALNLT